MVALLVVFPFGLLGALMSYLDSTIPKLDTILSTIILITGLVAGCMLGGYTTAKISRQKYIVHAAITGFVLTYLYALVNDFEFN
jgi:hypothetical protein